MLQRVDLCLKSQGNTAKNSKTYKNHLLHFNAGEQRTQTFDTTQNENNLYNMKSYFRKL